MTAISEWFGTHRTPVVWTLVTTAVIAGLIISYVLVGGFDAERPYAPYTAGPVIHTEPYAPYTAGPVVREDFRPYAPYTAGPVVPEVRKAPDPYEHYPYR